MIWVGAKFCAQCILHISNSHKTHSIRGRGHSHTCNFKGMLCGQGQAIWNVMCGTFWGYNLFCLLKQEVHSENLSTLHLFVWPWQPTEYNTIVSLVYTGVNELLFQHISMRTFWIQINWFHDQTKRNVVWWWNHWRV